MEDILYVMSLDSKELGVAEGQVQRQWKTVKERQRGKRWDRRGKYISTVLFNLKWLIEFSNTRVSYYDEYTVINIKKFLNKNFDCNSKFSRSSQSYSIFEIPIQFSESKVNNIHILELYPDRWWLKSICYYCQAYFSKLIFYSIIVSDWLDCLKSITNFILRNYPSRTSCYTKFHFVCCHLKILIDFLILDFLLRTSEVKVTRFSAKDIRSESSPLPLVPLLFSAICKGSSENHFAFLQFFFLAMVWSLPPVQCHEPPSIVLQVFYQLDLILESICHFHCKIIRDLI